MVAVHFRELHVAPAPAPDPEPRGVTRRIVAMSATFLTVLAAGGVWAATTAQSSPQAVQLRLIGGPGAILQASDMVPGVTVEGCADVEVVAIAGSNPGPLKLTATAVTGTLADHLHLTVEEGTPGSGACDLVTPTPVFSDSLARLGLDSAAPTNGVGTPGAVATGTSVRRYRITAAIPDDQSLQGASATGTFVWSVTATAVSANPTNPGTDPGTPAPSPSVPAPGPSAPAPAPSTPVPGPSAPAPNPTTPAPGPSAPAPGPSAPAPSPSAPAPSPSAPAPSPSAPAPNPTTPAPSPSTPVPGPSNPAPRPSATPATPAPGPSAGAPGPRPSATPATPARPTPAPSRPAGDDGDGSTGTGSNGSTGTGSNGSTGTGGLAPVVGPRWPVTPTPATPWFPGLAPSPSPSPSLAPLWPVTPTPASPWFPGLDGPTGNPWATAPGAAAPSPWFPGTQLVPGAPGGSGRGPLAPGAAPAERPGGGFLRGSGTSTPQYAAGGTRGAGNEDTGISSPIPGFDPSAWISESLPLDPQAASMLRAMAATSGFPVLLLLLILLFLVIQDRVDRRDPKLALAPLYPDADALFEGHSDEQPDSRLVWLARFLLGDVPQTHPRGQALRAGRPEGTS
ncbi:hypothetical protein NUM3379_42260 [Kineococcus sp. NUM-3379]